MRKLTARRTTGWHVLWIRTNTGFLSLSTRSTFICLTNVLVLIAFFIRILSHLGPFLFTLELLPLLKKTAASSPGVRVVNVGAQSSVTIRVGY